MAKKSRYTKYVKGMQRIENGKKKALSKKSVLSRLKGNRSK